MPACYEIALLEQSIADIKREVAKIPASRASVARELQSAKEAVELHRQNWDICVRNIRHMREVADHVVLDEYIEIRNNRDDERDLLDKARQRVAKVETSIKKMEAHIADMEAALAACQAEFAKYGQIRQFIKKA